MREATVDLGGSGMTAQTRRPSPPLVRAARSRGSASPAAFSLSATPSVSRRHAPRPIACLRDEWSCRAADSRGRGRASTTSVSPPRASLLVKMKGPARRCGPPFPSTERSVSDAPRSVFVVQRSRGAAQGTPRERCTTNPLRGASETDCSVDGKGGPHRRLGPSLIFARRVPGTQRSRRVWPG